MSYPEKGTTSLVTLSERFRTHLHATVRSRSQISIKSVEMVFNDDEAATTPVIVLRGVLASPRRHDVSGNL